MMDQEWVRNRPTWEIRNIAKALTYFSFINTPEENERLRVAKDELRQRARAKREQSR